jgi:protein-S-isoprenylcysteine O-methyltransferase Ste14
MYLGALLVLIGFGLWHASLAMLLLALPALALAHFFVVLYEEPTLRRRFGLPYVAYLARVRRWIPTPPRGNRGQSKED